MQKTVEIPSGDIELVIKNIQSPYTSIEQLLDFAARQNKKRKFLFVSKILGKHIPVKPSKMRETYDYISEQLGAKQETTLVVGMAETAIGLGGGVADSLSKKQGSGKVFFQNTTRHDLDCNVWFNIVEEHCHAPAHIVYEPFPELMNDIKAAERLVLVDDEISTGKTLLQMVGQYLMRLPVVSEVCIVSLVNWLDESRKEWFVKSIADFCDEIGGSVPCVKFVQLVEGEFKFYENDTFDMDLPPATDTGIETRGSVYHLGRCGLVMPFKLNNAEVDRHSKTNGPIAVVGYCEHVLEPFMLAEALEKMGKEVVFQSYTRSPIFVDKKAIKSAEVVSFSRDDSSELSNHFIYNLDYENYTVIKKTEQLEYSDFVEIKRI